MRKNIFPFNRNKGVADALSPEDYTDSSNRALILIYIILPILNDAQNVPRQKIKTHP